MSHAAVSGSLFPALGYGLGLRKPHFGQILRERPRQIDWFEVISENYMALEPQQAAPGLSALERIRSDYPVVLHGVSLSLGSADPLNQAYLERLKELAHCIAPAWVSDHLCWTGVNGQNLHDLMPLPYTEKVLEHVVERIARVQDVLDRRLVIENVSSYLRYSFSEMSEWDFLAAVAERADCGILLDVNNVYVSACNHGFDPEAYLAALPAHRIAQIHLAGHSVMDGYWVDTHDQPVCPEVWALYRSALRRFGHVSTNLEWDEHIPDLEVLCAELALARTQALLCSEEVTA